MAPKIHADISSRKNDPDAPETPYVVMLQAIELLAENEYIHRAWDFHHPLPANTMSDAAALGGGLIGLGDGGNDHNVRSSRATFKVPRRGVVHGLAGYFESVLFGDVELSTRPDTIDAKSKDMISWFPIFFPLKVRNGNAFLYQFSLRSNPCTFFPLYPIFRLLHKKGGEARDRVDIAASHVLVSSDLCMEKRIPASPLYYTARSRSLQPYLAGIHGMNSPLIPHFTDTDTPPRQL